MWQSGGGGYLPAPATDDGDGGQGKDEVAAPEERAGLPIFPQSKSMECTYAFVIRTQWEGACKYGYRVVHLLG